jgi:peroxiredoxin Q/BCP
MASGARLFSALAQSSEQQPSAHYTQSRSTFMKRLLSAVLLSSVMLPAFAALQVGDSAPAFTTQASQAGKAFTYSLKEYLKKGPVVVYFYPSAYTQGCNVQARTFAVNMEKFAAAGASVVGVSMDSIDRLNQFSADPEFCAGKLPVASDADGSIAKSFSLNMRDKIPGFKDTKGNIVDHGLIERTTYVITPDGKIAATIETKNGITPITNVEKSLEVVQALAAKK